MGSTLLAKTIFAFLPGTTTRPGSVYSGVWGTPGCFLPCLAGARTEAMRACDLLSPYLRSCCRDARAHCNCCQTRFAECLAVPTQAGERYVRSIYEQALGNKFNLVHPRIQERFGFSSKDHGGSAGRGVMEK